MSHPAKDHRSRVTPAGLLAVLAALVLLAVIFAPMVFNAQARERETRNRETQTRAEIGQMEVALAACRRELGDYKYPLPSRLVLNESNAYPNARTPGTDDYNTVQLLTSMFGNRWQSNTSGIDWNGDGVINPADRPITLMGDQVLVFFLGGIPSASSTDVLGFSTNPKNPADLTAPIRKGPYFPFSPDRLVRGPNGFLQYLDPYKTGTPYIYLSAGKSRNGYNVTTNGTTTVTDCPTLPLPPNPPAGATAQPVVIPYKDGSSGRYLNPDSYQIISAGADGVFGPGGEWDPRTGYGSPAAGPPHYFGKDDQANFSPNKLGRPAD
jgi:hypothetical protein